MGMKLFLKKTSSTEMLQKQNSNCQALGEFIYMKVCFPIVWMLCVASDTLGSADSWEQHPKQGRLMLSPAKKPCCVSSKYPITQLL